MIETQYFDLTPRKRALILEASHDLASPGDATAKPDRSGPPFVTQTSNRGRGLARRGAAKSPCSQQLFDKEKENVGNVCAPPEGGKGVLTKAALKRQQVVEELSQAQADARSRLCIFKSKGYPIAEENANAQAKDHESESELLAAETSTGGSRAGSRGHCAELTVPQGPVLLTSLRSSSRSHSACGRSFSTPMRSYHSVGEPELSQRSRGTSRERARVGTPERSVRSMRSMRSVCSLQSVKLSTSVFSASLVGRSVCTRPLTFPKGPVLATEARSRSHSVGARTPSVGTPERHSRSVSMHSARSMSRTPSRLTVPQAPVFATELRSRSRSVGTRTPAHSVGTPERSVRSCCSLTVARGPELATSLRSRSRSVDMRTPSSMSAKTVPLGPLRPHQPRSRSRSVDMRMPSYTGTATVAQGPELSTELRSRSRARTPSAHSVGTPERSIRSCRTPESFRSCASVRDSSIHSMNAQVRPLTEPIGPRLETEARSLSRRHQGCSASVTVDKTQNDAVQCEQSGQISEAQENRCEDSSASAVEHQELQPEAQPDKVASAACDTSSAEQEISVIDGAKGAAEDAGEAASSPPEQGVNESVPLESNDLASISASPLSSYLPQEAEIEPHCTPKPERCVESNKQEASGIDDTPTAESRAASRKQQVLAKVAEEHANIRKQRFVFGKPGTTPIRTPTRKKVQNQNHSEVQSSEVGTPA